MSAHFSKFMLNTYSNTPYFEAHAPADYPLSLTLQKCRAFRRLPPRLRELCGLAKRWAGRWITSNYPPDYRPDIDRWYDEDGYELNPDTGKRLTDEQIDEDWRNFATPDIEVKDIPLPAGGFADPDTWEEPEPEPDEDEDDDKPSLEQLINDIGGGRWRFAREYGVPDHVLNLYPDDEDLARATFDAVRGGGWPADDTGISAAKAIRVALPDELPNTNKAKPIKAAGVSRLPLPQARVLQALLPVAGEPPPLSRTELAQRMNVTATSGTISVALGGRSDSPHKGLLDAGLVTRGKGEGNESVYQITTEGIKAIEDYLKEHGELPPPRDKTLSTNVRYKEKMTPEWDRRAGLMLVSIYWKKYDDAETEDEFNEHMRLLDNEYNPVKEAVQDANSYDDLSDEMKAIFDRAEAAQKEWDEFAAQDSDGFGRFLGNETNIDAGTLQPAPAGNAPVPPPPHP